MQKQQKEFLDNLNISYHYMYKVLLSWEGLSENDSDAIVDNYPFKESFDEWLASYAIWIETVDRIFKNRIHKFDSPLTVGQLKEIIKDYDDNTQIVTSSNNGFWWKNINIIELPDDESMFTITLHTKDNFDTTQLGI